MSRERFYLLLSALDLLLVVEISMRLLSLGAVLEGRLAMESLHVKTVLRCCAGFVPVCRKNRGEIQKSIKNENCWVLLL